MKNYQIYPVYIFVLINIFLIIYLHHVNLQRVNNHLVFLNYQMTKKIIYYDQHFYLLLIRPQNLLSLTCILNTTVDLLFL